MSSSTGRTDFLRNTFSSLGKDLRGAPICRGCWSPFQTMVPSRQMRRCLIHFTVVLAMFSVAANTLCYATCISSCDPASQPVRGEHDQPCHHHKEPTAPLHEDQSCTHPQLFTNDSPRTVVPVPAEGMFQALAPEPSAIGLDHISQASVGVLESPPSSFPDSVSSTILRV